MRSNRPHVQLLILFLALGLTACDSAPETNGEEEPTEQIEAPEETTDDAPEEEAQEAPEDDPLAAPDIVSEPPEDAEFTDSGLAYLVLEEGHGDTHPEATDSVSVHYTGWHTDGEMFDSSVERGEPTSFPLNQVIPGWTEGVQLMVEGEKTLFWIPEELAYGGRPGAPAGMLVFEVELLEIE